jgi:hypothetical protein
MVKGRFGRMIGWLGYSLAGTHISQDLTAGFPWHPEIRHDLKICGTYRLGGLRLSAAWLVRSGRPYSVPENTILAYDDTSDVKVYIKAPDVLNQSRLPAVSRLDSGISYDFESRYFSMQVGVSFYNLLDRRNTWYRGLLFSQRVVTADVAELGSTTMFHLRLCF